jgi:hypothetical protein
LRWLESLPDYPAVFLPSPQGGFEVIFPNLPEVKAYGVKLASAEKAGVEILTHTLLETLLAGEAPPKASDPERLHPDPDEPPGTRLVMLRPDRTALRRRLNLEQREKGKALRAFGLYGK